MGEVDEGKLLPGTGAERGPKTSRSPPKRPSTHITEAIPVTTERRETLLRLGLGGDVTGVGMGVGGKPSWICACCKVGACTAHSAGGGGGDGMLFVGVDTLVETDSMWGRTCRSLASCSSCSLTTSVLCGRCVASSLSMLISRLLNSGAMPGLMLRGGTK